jgi:hypothetical protein
MRSASGALGSTPLGAVFANNDCCLRVATLGFHG